MEWRETWTGGDVLLERALFFLAGLSWLALPGKGEGKARALSHDALEQGLLPMWTE